MKPQAIALLATAVSLCVLPLSAASGVRDERPNLIGGELAGRGIALTLNYERYLTNQFGLGAGIFAIQSGGSGIVILPVYASLVPGDSHSPYFSAGATLLSGGGDLNDWESTWVLSVSFGYQYQSSGGFFVRPFFTYLRPFDTGAGDGSLLWPGLSIGGSF